MLKRVWGEGRDPNSSDQPIEPCPFRAVVVVNSHMTASTSRFKFASMIPLTGEAALSVPALHCAVTPSETVSRAEYWYVDDWQGRHEPWAWERLPASARAGHTIVGLCNPLRDWIESRTFAMSIPDVTDEHYLKAATELGDSQAVIAHEAIYSTNGIKLVERGVRVDSRLCQRLLNHKLQVPIDNSLTAEGMVTLDELRHHAECIMAERPFYGRLGAKASDRAALLGAIGSIPLPQAVAFRLTVARARRAAVFSHSLRVSLIALYLGICQELAGGELRALAAAALMQDVGMLHIDPNMLRADHTFNAADRRHLHAHPLVATMIVKQHSEYPPSVARAILDHHERHDGTGYPRGLKGEEISVMGRILLLAEVVAAVLDKKIRAPAERAALILRLNHFKFDSAMSKVMLQLLDQEAVDAADSDQCRRSASRLKRLCQEFDEWSQARSEMDAYASGAPAIGAFLTDRVAELERSLADAGLHPDQLKSAIVDVRDQPAAIAELAMLARETGWQLSEIIQETLCRFPAIETTEDASEGAIRDWLLSKQKRLKVRRA